MTNEELVERGYCIVWNGAKDHYFSPPEWPRGDRDPTVLPQTRDIGCRDRILAALSDRDWRSRHEVAALAHVEPSRASGELWYLRERGLVERIKDQGLGVWLFRRRSCVVRRMGLVDALWVPVRPTALGRVLRA